MSARVDIAVVGGGAAGVAAAVAAARAGRRTLLLDQRAGAGGTGGFSGLTTLCGLYDEGGRFLNDGFAREFAEAVGETAPVRMGRVWVLPYRPARFREVAAALIQATSNIETRWNQALTGVVREGNRLVGLGGIEAGAVIDCTGTAEVARALGEDCLATDETTQAPATIFALHQVTRSLCTAADVAQVLLPLARAGLPPLSFQPSLEPGAVTVKFSGGPGEARRVIEFLQREVRGFEHCLTPTGEFTATARAGRMIAGQYLLTGADVRAGRKFPDAVARGAWPIEQWNREGVARFGYLAAGTHYEIPARSLRAARTRNLFMGGKTISADVEAMASARVMGCCLATGAAAGNLAARWLESGGTT